jgi:hypothetical protein
MSYPPKIQRAVYTGAISGYTGAISGYTGAISGYTGAISALPFQFWGGLDF